MWTAIAQSVYRLATGLIFRGSNPGGGGRDFPHPSRLPWVPPSLLYNGYRVFPGGKAAGAWRWPPTPHLALRLKKEYISTSTPPLGLRGLFQGELYRRFQSLLQCTAVLPYPSNCLHLLNISHFLLVLLLRIRVVRPIFFSLVNVFCIFNGSFCCDICRRRNRQDCYVLTTFFF